jgi:hypothetical protein
VAPGIVTLDSIVICSEINDQQAPTVSYGDSIFLVSWLDKREGLPAIYSARVTMDGAVIEQNGFILHADSMNQIAPVSAFDGNNFLVAWVGFDAGGFGVYAKRISPVGAIIDSLPIQLCYDPTPKYNPALCFGGMNYAVTWDDARINGAEYDEWCARISTEGILLDTNGIAVDTSPGYQYSPSVAYLFPYFLAIWTDDQYGNADLVGKRIDMNGTVIDQTAIPISSASGTQLEGSICAGNERYCVSWEDSRNGYEQKDIYGEFVDTTGTGLHEDVVPAKAVQEVTLSAVPNPFCKQVEIRFDTHGNAENLRIQVFDACGRVVKKHTVSSARIRSPQIFVWDRRDDLGREVAAGVYFMVVRQGAAQYTQSLLLIR